MKIVAPLHGLFSPLSGAIVLLFGLWACGGREAVSGDGGTSPESLLEIPAPGIEELTDIAALPLLRYGSQTRQVSSHDKDGGNDDGFDGSTQLYMDEHGGYVVFDEYGPGCIYRMWFTAVAAWVGELSIYVDDMDDPVVRCPFRALFSSRQWPFVSPLTAFLDESSGGYVSYIPICYRQRAKITLSVPPEFYNITYRRYASDRSLCSYTGREDYGLLFEQWRSAGADPKPRLATRTKTSTVIIPPHARQGLVSEQGAGALWNMYLDVAPLDSKTTSSLWIAAAWDGHDMWDVYAPLNEFFCSQDPSHPARGLLLGRTDAHGYYCHFPMPYWSSALVVLENRGPDEVIVNGTAEILDVPYPRASGYFSAYYNCEDPTRQGVDYRFASVDGAGHFVGVSYTMKGPIDGSYMEGDERFYVDESRSPALYGTGTEDYFNGGWYFWLGRFSLPLHGSAFSLVWTPRKRSTTAAYRVHVGDMVPFFRNARMGIEHDADNTNTDDSHTSVAYLYRYPARLLCLTDEIDVGERRSMQDHGYTAVGAEPTAEIASFYEGQEDTVLVRDSGHMVRVSSEFVARVAKENVGILLRRRLDQSRGRQKALVYVDGGFAGVWYDVYENPLLRWADSDFLVPSSLTAGKDRVQIKIVNDGQAAWSEFLYLVYSYLPPAPQ